MDDPEFELYDKFGDDWDTFTSELKEELGQFLDFLQKNYDNPYFLRSCTKEKTYWASVLLGSGYKVLWKTRAAKFYSLNRRVEAIRILGVEPI